MRGANRGPAKLGHYNRVSRARKFLAFDLNGIPISDVSPRGAFILLNWPLSKVSRLNRLLVDREVGDTLIYNGVEFTLVSHNYVYR